jgi:Domain of unknown function (DUF1707)
LRTTEPRASLDDVSKRGSLRASDEDRERVIERLHKAATEGRIASEELEHRVSVALKARTYDELEETVTDLPSPRRGREPVRHSSPHWALAMVRANPMLLLFAIPVLAVTAAMLLAATVVWTVLVIALLVLGGRGGAPRPPWVYARRRGVRPRRGPGRYWA